MAIGAGVVENDDYKPTRDEKVLLDIQEAFGLTKDDFVDGKVIYTKWGNEDKLIDIEDLGEYSLKISKDLGDVYVERIKTNGYVLVGTGTVLHCDNIDAGKKVIENFKGFLM